MTADEFTEKQMLLDAGGGAGVGVDADGDIERFFVRNGCDARTRQACDEYARQRFPDVQITPCRPQGYCSYTLVLTDGHLVQFRPEAFQLDLERCGQAKAIYGHLAPATTLVGTLDGIPLAGATTATTPPILRVYCLEQIPGIPFSEFRSSPEFAANAREFRERLLGDLAWALALSFLRRRSASDGSSGSSNVDGGIARGRIGSSLRSRLDLLEACLRPAVARGYVSDARGRLPAVEEAPWCLTHGDLLPGNIMVDPGSGHMTGLIDWAEAEWLPFGMALYGVEEVLEQQQQQQQQQQHRGNQEERKQTREGEEKQVGGQFEYCADHEELRGHFWDRLLALSRCGDMGIRPWLGEVEAARKMGVLLWIGIAFDDGRLDRVIEEGRDEEEMRRLMPFLEARGPVDEEDGDRGEEEEDRERGRLRRWMLSVGCAFGGLCS